LDRSLHGPQSRSRQRGEKKILDFTGRDTKFDPLVIQPVASYYSDYAILAPIDKSTDCYKQCPMTKVKEDNINKEIRNDEAGECR
jgi:hypothetical protein